MKLNFHNTEKKTRCTAKRNYVCAGLKKFSFSNFSFGLLILFISLSNTNVRATTTVSSSSCPVHFTGVVESVVDSSAPFSPMAPGKSRPKITITFSVVEVASDSQEEVGETFTLNIVKGGPQKFTEGDEYEVYAENGYLCKAKSTY